MSNAARMPEIEQAFYGSFSGTHDFRILAASDGLSRDEREAILHHSNLGGSALTADSPEPIYTFYELAGRRGRRWAFSRTVFLGRERRGNNYLVHVLAFGEDTMDRLRGDLFLLEDLGLLSRDKPREEATLPVLFLPAAEANLRSRRRLGEAAPGFPPERLVGALRGLSAGPVALQVPDGAAGKALCRAVLAVLPPADRERLSFCTRFTLQRGAAFHLAAFVAEDAALTERYLPRFDLGRAELAPAPAEDPFTDWMKEVGKGVEPLYGFSLLERPEQAAPTIDALRRWSDWIADRIGTSPAEDAQRRGLPVVAIAGDERNRRLDVVGRLLVDAALEEVKQRVEAALAGGEKPLASIAEACAVVRERDPEGKAVERMLLDEDRRRSRPGAKTRPLEDITAAVAAALLGGERARLDRIYDPKGGRALLRGREEAAVWLLTLHRASPLACLELVTAWIIHWRLAQGLGMQDEFAVILAALPQNWTGPDVAATVRTGIASLEAAAPPAGPDGERAAWFLALLAGVRSRLKSLFPGTIAARLALDEDLFPRLPPGDLEELAPLCASTFPGRLAESLGRSPAAGPVLAVLLVACRDGFLGRKVGGREWDVYREPAYWDLAARIAAQAASAPKLLENLTWLLWAASRLISKAHRGGSEQANRLLTEALGLVIAANPRGIMDIAVRVVYRLILCGWDLRFPIDGGGLLRFRIQAGRDAMERSLHPGLCHGTLMRIASLDKRRWFDSGGSTDR